MPTIKVKTKAKIGDYVSYKNAVGRISGIYIDGFCDKRGFNISYDIEPAAVPFKLYEHKFNGKKWSESDYLWQKYIYYYKKPNDKWDYTDCDEETIDEDDIKITTKKKYDEYVQKVIKAIEADQKLFDEKIKKQEIEEKRIKQQKIKLCEVTIKGKKYKLLPI